MVKTERQRSQAANVRLLARVELSGQMSGTIFLIEHEPASGCMDQGVIKVKCGAAVGDQAMEKIVATDMGDFVGQNRREFVAAPLAPSGRQYDDGRENSKGCGAREM